MAAVTASRQQEGVQDVDGSGVGVSVLHAVVDDHPMMRCCVSRAWRVLAGGTMRRQGCCGMEVFVIGCFALRLCGQGAMSLDMDSYGTCLAFVQSSCNSHLCRSCTISN